MTFADHWVQRLRAVLRRIEALPGEVSVTSTDLPRLSKGDLSRVTSNLRVSIPASLSEFLLDCESPLAFEYGITPPGLELGVSYRFWGSAALWDVAGFFGLQTGCYDWASAWLKRGRHVQEAALCGEEAGINGPGFRCGFNIPGDKIL